MNMIMGSLMSRRRKRSFLLDIWLLLSWNYNLKVIGWSICHLLMLFFQHVYNQMIVFQTWNILMTYLPLTCIQNVINVLIVFRVRGRVIIDWITPKWSVQNCLHKGIIIWCIIPRWMGKLYPIVSEGKWSNFLFISKVIFNATLFFWCVQERSFLDMFFL